MSTARPLISASSARRVRKISCRFASGPSCCMAAWIWMRPSFADVSVTQGALPTRSCKAAFKARRLLAQLLQPSIPGSCAQAWQSSSSEERLRMTHTLSSGPAAAVSTESSRRARTARRRRHRRIRERKVASSMRTRCQQEEYQLNPQRSLHRF